MNELIYKWIGLYSSGPRSDQTGAGPIGNPKPEKEVFKAKQGELGTQSEWL